ncbi:hypothetical protein CEXT_103731 [Caerostris extrusa]|uniref:Uncharacterized protein n=1 Tax=Caerostris extrusa TaxID=172846 RepID=A0AAV4QE71_CAEEX|nr:hypothetical protein CEXT_103731 [Caerostris extrusa]
MRFINFKLYCRFATFRRRTVPRVCADVSLNLTLEGPYGRHLTKSILTGQPLSCVSFCTCIVANTPSCLFLVRLRGVLDSQSLPGAS